jgi:hypothetical protein
MLFQEECSKIISYEFVGAASKAIKGMVLVRVLGHLDGVFRVTVLGLGADQHSGI